MAAEPLLGLDKGMPKLAPLHALAPLVFWALLLLCPRANGFELSAAFALIVAYPLTLRIDRDTPEWLRRTALFAGVIASLSLILPPAPATAGVAAVWFVFAIPNLAYGFTRFVNAPDKRDACVWAEAASVVGPLVGAAALVQSRGWQNFCGFPEPLATLTVTHFHFTLGLLPLALAALTRHLRDTGADTFSRKLATGGLWGVVFTPPVVGLFFMLRTEKMAPGYAEAVATVALALSVAIWAHAAFWKLAPKLDIADAWALRAASVLLTLATALGAWYSATIACGNVPPTFHAMLRWHGVANALATITLAMVALRAAAFHGIRNAEPVPDLDAPTTDIPEEKAIFRDARTFEMGADTPGRFEAIRDALLGYRFYPDEVMESAAAFKTENRFARVGDRIAMSLCVPVFPGLPALRFPATTEIHLLENTPDRAALGYVTTRHHYGRGAWSATLTRADGNLRLELHSRMTPTHPLALLGLPFYRFLQKRAHRLGAENLRNLQA
jgi:hypothetical protein